MISCCLLGAVLDNTYLGHDSAPSDKVHVQCVVDALHRLGLSTDTAQRLQQRIQMFGNGLVSFHKGIRVAVVEIAQTLVP